SEREFDVVQLSQEASCRAFEKGRAGDCRKIAERVRSSIALVWASTGDDRGRWTSVPNRSVEEQQIWIGIARLDAQAAAEEGLSWPRLPRRIRRCGCISRREWGFRRLLVDRSLLEEYVSGFHRCGEDVGTVRKKKEKCSSRKLADREGESTATTNG
ncbi:hypothetical protein GW17_00047613, partial [Ensete ventricosum]